MQSFGDGYVVEDGKLPRESFAIASYEDPVKMYPLNRARANEVTI